METLEQMLSPILTNARTTGTQIISENDKMFLDKIQKQKLDVIKGYIEPSQVDTVRPEIVESWIRSYRNGLHPDSYQCPPVMDAQQFKERLKKKAFLLQAARLYIQKLDHMLSDIESYIFLSDEQGIILHVVQAVGENKFRLAPGTIWTEKTIGTCAHGMCILLRCPIQLCGREHFSNIFKNISCSSAPIFDEKGNLEGSLTISSPNLHNQNPQTLGLAVTMALAIQKEFQLSVKNELFNATIASADDILLFIDEVGRVTDLNAAAKSIFGFSEKGLNGLPVEDLIGEQPLIQSVLKSGNTIADIHVPIKKSKENLFLTSIQPIKNYDGENAGCLLNIKEAEQIRKSRRSAHSSVIKFTFDNIIGSSPQSLKLIKTAKRFAHFNSNILIQGESGTGKDVYAQAIHYEGRPSGPYIAVNCAAIPQNLIESELFGYEGGAFTGAERQGKPGKIELANGGTLFLDEIGDMPLELQAVLLRVLEDKMVMHVGGSRYIPVDFKLITATNKDLLELVEKKKFREDLYYRISVFKLDIPPLRERGADIFQLIEHFIKVYAQRQNLDEPLLSNAAKYILLQYPWPGNIRQLQNAISYAVCMNNEGVICPEHLPPEILNYQSNASASSLEPSEIQLSAHEHMAENNYSMKEIEKKAIEKALIDSNHHIRIAAKTLGLSKSTLYRKIKEYELMPLSDSDQI